jgi:hemolysin activation/secretion protein
LQALAGAMSAAYAHSNVALFTVVIPNQDLTGGTVKVLVGEGYLETVVLKGEVEGRSLSLVKAYAEKLRREKPLSRARFERYLSLIRDIPGLRVQTALKLGKTRGGVILELTLDYDKPRVSFSYDSRSTSLIGDGRIEADVRLPHLLREGDSTEIAGIVSPDFSSLRYIGIGHSTPLGSEGTRLALNYSHLETHLKDIDLDGSADTAGLTLTHPFIRNFHSQLTARLSADLVNSNNSAFGSEIANEKVRSVRGGVTYATWNAHRTIAGSLVVSKGLDVLGASVVPASGEETYLKLSGSASWAQEVGKRIVFRLQGAGQYTRDPLPVSERFSVGGATFGRGFEQGLIIADRGLAGSAELAVRPLSGDFARSELYGFVDYAAVRLVPRPGFGGADIDLGSAGMGVRAAWKDKAMLGLEAARVIDRPYPAYPGDWRFTVSWRLSLRP